jgi:molybdopterin-guanine dinucleotide biosynthesis protein A
VLAPTREEITGLILAGGRATRMGGIDKGLVELRGRTLVERVIERLHAQVAGLVISANRNVERYRAFGFPVVLDAQDGLEPFPGPLAGILAGLREAPTPWMAVAPCDAPFLPMNLVQHLVDALAGSRAAVAYVGELIEPLFCLLHTDLADDLAQSLAHGERRAEIWLRSVGAAPAVFALPEQFANLNTLQELRARDADE